VDSLGGGLPTMLLTTSGALKVFQTQIARGFSEIAYNMKQSKDSANALKAEMEMLDLFSKDPKLANVGGISLQNIIDKKKEFLSFGKLISDEQNDEINLLLKKKALEENRLEILQASLKVAEDFANAIKPESNSEIQLSEKTFNPVDASSETLSDNFTAAEDYANNVLTKIADVRKELENVSKNTKKDFEDLLKTNEAKSINRPDFRPTVFGAKNKKDKTIQAEADKILDDGIASVSEIFTKFKSEYKGLFEGTDVADVLAPQALKIEKIIKEALTPEEAMEEIKKYFDVIEEQAKFTIETVKGDDAASKESKISEEINATDNALDDLINKLKFAENTET
jgi:hypothetical protein